MTRVKKKITIKKLKIPVNVINNPCHPAQGPNIPKNPRKMMLIKIPLSHICTQYEVL